MDTARISTKGQLVIPSRVRKALNLRSGDRVSFLVEGETLLLRRAQSKPARLVEKDGRKVLVAASGAPPMTPEIVRGLLAEFP